MATTETAPAERPDYDPVALAESLASAADKSAKVLGDFIARQAAAGKSMVTDEFGLTQAFLELAAKMLSTSYRLAETQMNLWWEYSALWQSSNWTDRKSTPCKWLPAGTAWFRRRKDHSVIWKSGLCRIFLFQSYPRLPPRP